MISNIRSGIKIPTSKVFFKGGRFMGSSNDDLISLENLNKVLSADNRINESLIHQSGNSDVDVTVKIDTTPIAFAMLCSLLATKQLSNREFESAVRKLEELTNNNRTFHSLRERNDASNVKLFSERKKRR